MPAKNKTTKTKEGTEANKNIMEKLINIRWPDGITCVYCGERKVCRHETKNRSRLQCWGCKKSFSATVGTIFQGTHIDIETWGDIFIQYQSNKKITPKEICLKNQLSLTTADTILLKIKKATKSKSKEQLKKLFLE